MNRRRIYILVNGILNIPGDAKDWNARGVTFIHTRKCDAGHAEKLEYFCGPIGRAFGQNRRARKLAALIEQYRWANCAIYLVGHSNGCDVILDALVRLGWPRIEEVHLFSGACEADFARNGLNDALREGKVGEAFVYVAGRDCWLRLAHSWLGKLLGYRTLGLKGATAVSPEADPHVHTLEREGYGHSTWWTIEHFTESMQLVLRYA